MRLGKPLSLMALPAVCIGWLMFIWGWDAAVVALPVDDSYYYLKTAVNLAQGYGPSFDRINPTNGFHPLWLLVLAGMAHLLPAASHDMMGLVLATQVGMVFAAIELLRRISFAGSERLRPVFAALLLNCYFAKVYINGQESALQLLAICAGLACSERLRPSIRSEPVKVGVVLGLLAGAAALARLDAVLFACMLVAMPALWPPGSEGKTLARQGYKAVLTGGAVLSVIMGSYLALNLLTQGHVVPVSIAIKAGSSKLHMMAALLGFSLLAGGTAIIALRTLEKRASIIGRRFLDYFRFVTPLVFYCLASIGFMLMLYGRLDPAIWYYVPHMLFLALLLSAATDVAPRNRFVALTIAIVILVGAVITFVSWRHRLAPCSYSPYVAARRTGEWLKDHTPTDALIAGWDCGIAGYYSQRRFMNLDGLINSWDYKERFLDKRGTEEFVHKEHYVDYIAQLFWKGHLTRSRDFRGVDLSRYIVIHEEQFSACLATSMGAVRSGAFLVLSQEPAKGAVSMEEQSEPASEGEALRSRHQRGR